MMVKTIVMDEGTKQQKKLTPDRLMNFVFDSIVSNRLQRGFIIVHNKIEQLKIKQ